MARKKRSRRFKVYSIPLILLIGIIVSAVFIVIYGFMMWLRYFLGALMFATVTLLIVKWINHKTKGRKVGF